MIAIINAKIVLPHAVEEGTLLMEGDKIVACGKVYVPAGVPTVDAKGLYVGPGFVDQHVHGYSAEEVLDSLESVKAVAEKHLLHGTTTIIPSVGYSYTQEEFLSMVEQCLPLVDDPDSTVEGIHFEGPFINPKRGANSHLCWNFSRELCDKIFSAAQGKVLHCTYAPELPCAEELEKVFREHGVIGAMGHSNADPESIYRGVRNGSRIVTHLYDAMGNCRPDAAAVTGDPQDCVSDIVLSIPGLYYELICDSRCVHVTAVSQRQALRCAGEDHIILISDATGRYKERDADSFPPEDIRSAKDLNFNQAGQLSGSCLTLAGGAANFKRTTGADVRTVFKCAATNSATVLGLSHKVGSLEAGKLANLVFVDEDLKVHKVFFRGKEIPNIR